MFGDGAAVAATLGEYGATAVLSVVDPAIEEYLVAPKAEALAQIVAERTPAAVLITSSAEGKEIAGRLAVKLGAGLITDATDVAADGSTTPSSTHRSRRSRRASPRSRVPPYGRENPSSRSPPPRTSALASSRSAGSEAHRSRGTSSREPCRFHGGRPGHMPTWDERLTPAEIKILSLYVNSLRGEKP